MLLPVVTWFPQCTTGGAVQSARSVLPTQGRSIRPGDWQSPINMNKRLVSIVLLNDLNFQSV